VRCDFDEMLARQALPLIEVRRYSELASAHNRKRLLYLSTGAEAEDAQL